MHGCTLIFAVLSFAPLTRASVSGRPVVRRGRDFGSHISNESGILNDEDVRRHQQLHVHGSLLQMPQQLKSSDRNDADIQATGQQQISSSVSDASGATLLCEEVAGDMSADLRPFFDCEIISAPNVTYLTQADFEQGTYIIDSAGIFILSEDIAFEPNTPGHFPPVNSTVYSQEKGYWLGFFAAIAVVAEDVLIDLNGFEIKMSAKFLRLQRFFSIIELGSRPFKAGQGPAQFKKMTTPFVPAHRVIITNGTLGLSSHMGVHGNENANIFISDVNVVDFETGGIQFNGASQVHILRTIVGPSLGATGSSSIVPGLSTLSQGVLLRHIVDTEMPEIFRFLPEFENLRHDLDDFIDGTSNQNLWFQDPAFFSGLPDGGALYGILFHVGRPAVKDFAICSAAEATEWAEMLSSDQSNMINITDVIIRNLSLQADEVMQLIDQDGKAVQGPAGDIVQVMRLQWYDGTYKPNALSEAQRKLAELKANDTDENETSLFLKYGTTNIPADVLEWMRGDKSLADAVKDKSFRCNEDSQAHHNKGAVGLRLEHMSEYVLSNVSISGLRNSGLRSPHSQRDLSFCNPSLKYKGLDVRGVSTSSKAIVPIDNITGLPIGVTFDPASFIPSSGGSRSLFVNENVMIKDQSDCHVRLYEHWPENMTDAIVSAIGSSPTVWHHKYKTGETRTLSITGDQLVGIFPLGAFGGKLSSVKVRGDCCRVEGYESTDCSGDHFRHGIWSSASEGADEGVVPSRIKLAVFEWGNDAVYCVKLVHECTQFR
jgi:hypothetical protein